MAIDDINSQDQPEAAADQQRLLSEIGRIVSSSPNLDAVFSAFAEQARKLIPFDRLAISTVDPETGLISDAHISGFETDELNVTGPYSLEDSALPAPVYEDHVVVSVSADELKKSAETDVVRDNDIRISAGLISAMFTPLVLQGRLVGSLVFRSKQADPYGEREAGLAEQIAAQIAGVISSGQQVALLEKESQKRQQLADEQAGIAAIGRIVSSSLDLDEVLSAFVEQARSLVPFDRIVVSTVDEQMTEVTDVLVDGILVPEDDHPVSQPLSPESMLRLPARQRSTIVLNGENYIKYAAAYPPEMVRKKAGVKSLVVTPLEWQGGVVGSLNLRSKKPDAYDPHVVELIEQIGAQIAGAVAAADQYRKLEEQAAERQRLANERAAIAEIGRIVSSTLDIEDVLAAFVEQARSLVPFDRIVVTLVNDDMTEVTDILVDGLEVDHGSIGESHPFSENVIQSKIITNQERLVVNGAQYREHADRNPTEQRRYDAGLRSLLMVPLVWQGRSIGSLNLRSTNPNAYGEHEIELAEQISAQIAGAIATSAQYTLIEAESSERQRLAEEQSVIAQIGRIASSSLDTNEVFTTFSEQAQKLIPFDRFVVSVISEDRSELIDEFVYGIKFDDSLEGLHIPVSQIFEYQHLFVNKLPLNLSGDELSNLKDSPEEKIRISFGFKALLVVPLEWHDQVIGLITFRALDPDAFGEHEVEVAVQISAQIAGAIATSNQYRLLRAALADVELNAAALEAADDAIIIRNADSSVAYVNSGFERQTGFSRDEVVGTDFMYPEHDDSGSDGLENLWDQLRRGESWRKIVPSTRKDGTEYIVDASLTPIFNESGEIDKFLGVRRDVTAMVRADESIRLQAAALEAADDAIVLVNSETAIEWVNEAFVRDTGYTREEAIGQKSPFLRSDKVPDQLFDDMWASVGDGKTWHSRLWVRRKDGTDYPVEGSVTPVFDDDGNVAHYIGIRRDITELLQAEKDREATRDLDAQNKQLLELNEQREEFFSTVSHELRTPLTSVMAFADILSRDRDGTLTNRQQEHLNVIKRNSRNLNSLVEDMLDFSRMTTDQLRLEKSEFEIHSLLDSVVESLEPTAHQRDQALWIEPHTEPIWVTADHSRVVQILSNLITNSCKYSPASTRITVAVGYEPGFLSMVVTDQGIGIPPEVIENIYSPFFRSGQHEVREEVGTGLGLAISKTLVDLHNGTISAESVVNQGTTITVTLPGASPTPTVNAKT